MTDKEVGKLWHDVNLVNGFWEQSGAKEPMVDLIRKLVEERANQYDYPEALQDALRDFGIPEETWKTKR